MQYDEQNDKTYLMAHAVIPEEYTASADIIRRKGGTKVSCEIAIDTMNYNEDTGILDIIDFSFLGCCLLGDHVTEGMAGARADIESIADFSAENNSVTANAEFNNTLVETLKKLNETLDKFNNKSPDEKGGEDAMNKFEELLELYGLEESEIEFEVEGLSDEDLEAAFTEAFGDAEEFKKKKKCSEENSEGDDDFAGCGKKKKRCSVNAEAGTVEFEMSHDDVRMALYSLLESSWDENSYSWICEVYDNYFVYQKETYSDSGYKCNYYKQNYSKNNDNVELSGDAVEVFSTFVTESEKTALDMMRTQYDELKKFHDETIAAQEQAKKDAILNDEKYSEIADTEQFAELKKDAAKFSVEELETKAKLIFADVVMAKGEHIEKKINKIGFNFSEKPKKAQAYGGLFDN